jgi:hypothetical protein
MSSVPNGTTPFSQHPPNVQVIAARALMVMVPVCPFAVRPRLASVPITPTSATGGDNLQRRRRDLLGLLALVPRPGRGRGPDLDRRQCAHHVRAVVQQIGWWPEEQNYYESIGQLRGSVSRVSLYREVPKLRPKADGKGLAQDSPNGRVHGVEKDSHEIAE